MIAFPFGEAYNRISNMFWRIQNLFSSVGSVFFRIGFCYLQDPAARRATAAATWSVSRERFGLGAAIRILDEMKFPTLDEMNFPTHSEVDFGARFWQPF